MLTRPIIGGITSTIIRSIIGPGIPSGRSFNAIVAALFANGEQGFAYDTSDFSTLFQNSAGTVPVTAAGQPVGLMLDKSGRGNHVSFGDGASRPMLQYNATTGAYYLQPDGADDSGVTGSINFTGTDKVSVFAGVRKLSDAASGVVLELGNDVTQSFRLYAPAAAGADKFAFASRGTTAEQRAATTSTAFNAPFSAVLSCYGGISTDTSILRINGVQVASNSGDQGAGTYGNLPLYMFRRGGTTLPFSGHFYGCIVVGRLVTDGEARNVDRLFASRTGVTLA